MGYVAFFLLIISMVIQMVYLFRRPESRDPISRFTNAAVFLDILLILVLRSIEIEFVAVTSIFESLLLFSAFLAGLGALYAFQRRLPFRPKIVFGATALSFVFLALASSPLAPSEALPPIPALQSGWLVLHVSLAFIGEAFFAVSFVAAVTALCTSDARRLEELDRIMYTSAVIGYPIFTAGALVFGAVWAEKAWGRYWSWDPKETWALVTWLVYTIYLHVRLTRGRGTRLPQILLIIGFALTVFTFLGVNFLLSGLHSYG